MERPPSRPVAGLPGSLVILVVALIPGLVALLPGLLVPLWNLTDPVQKTYLTTGRRVYLGFWMLLAVMPFVASAAIPFVLRRNGTSWAVGVRWGALAAGVLGVAAFVLGAVSMGGL